MSARAFVAIGANLGEVRSTLEAAVGVLERSDGIGVVGHSPLYETSPVGGPADQPTFLNAALELETTLSPHHLLRTLLAIELEFARERTVRWGPRTLDLDLLLYGPEVVIDDPPELVLPHPRMTERAFVLIPMQALAPSLVVPTVNTSITALCADLPASERSGVHLAERDWVGGARS